MALSVTKKRGRALRILKKDSTGFSAVELMVTLSIITVVSIGVLLSFSGVNEGAALNRSAQELALGIRQAQNMALGIRQAQIILWPTQIPAGRRVIRQVGIRLTRSGAQANRFFLFADVDDPGQAFDNANNKYDNITSGPPFRRRNEMIINSTVIFPRNVRVNGFLCDGFTCSGNPPSINVIFYAPESRLEIHDQPSNNSEDNGETILSNGIAIELRAPSGQTKTVVVRTNGQISIK